MSDSNRKPKVLRTIILLEVHPEETRFSVTNDHVVNRKVRTGIHKLSIYQDEMGAKLIETTAHELGHVLQKLFDTPAAAGDPRNGASSYDGWRIDKGYVSSAEALAIVAAESEAWDFGKLMVDDLAPGPAEKALDTYRAMLNDEELVGTR